MTPASACLSTAMIWLSVNRDLRMWNLLSLLGYKIPLITSIIFRGDYLHTEWDLEAIRSSDIVFAYFEDSNPGGYGLSLETGYAAALGKHIILVDEKSLHSTDAGRYLKIVRATSNVVFDSLSEGINYLKSLS